MMILATGRYARIAINDSKAVSHSYYSERVEVIEAACGNSLQQLG